MRGQHALKTGLPALGWETPADLGGEAKRGQAFGRGGTSAGCKASKFILRSSHFLQRY